VTQDPPQAADHDGHDAEHTHAGGHQAHDDGGHQAHDDGDDHGHDGDPVAESDDDEVARAIWRNDNVELVTVGIDIGSATSHLMFAKLHLQRQAHRFSSRFIVVERHTLSRSPIHLTPYRADGLIDVDALRAIVEAAYADAALARDEVDAGAVILTGVALERANARAIAELFAAEGGKFVCASAGHNLEALLAAHGSGAVARSRGGGPVLNIDIGGGTTKLALAEGGRVVATLAISAGARLVVLDAQGRLARVEHGASALAARLGLPLVLGSPLTEATRRALADGFARRIVEAANGRADPASTLAGGLPAAPRPASIVISGGVGELLGAAAGPVFGDLGRELAAALAARFAELPAPVAQAGERIRATVIGASQFSVQLSGNTVHLSDDRLLPLHNVPVVATAFDGGPLTEATVAGAIASAAERLDLTDAPGPIAIAVEWDLEPAYPSLRALAAGIAGAHRAAARAAGPIIVALTGDIAASLGSILHDEVGWHGDVIAVDGLELADLDYIDIGERILPANVVPVVVKSLVFPDVPGRARPEILVEVN